MNKLCPLRKKYIRSSFNLYGQGVPAFDYIEEFDECIKDKCAAYYIATKYNGYGVPVEKTHKCSLLNNDLYKETI